MRLIDQLKAGIQPYTARPALFSDKPVGYLSSKLVMDKNDDYFINNYIILMKTPSYDGYPLDQTVPIGTLYSLERGLFCYIIAQGSFFRTDGRNGIALLNEEMYKTHVLKGGKEPTEYSEEFVARFIEWLKLNDWQFDYPSYTFLHSKLSSLANKFHGMPAHLASPKTPPVGFFVSKYLRNSKEIHSKLQNFLTLSKSISDKIASARFNIVEVQYGYSFRFDKVSKWYLDIDIYFGLRNGNSRTIFRESLEAKFCNQRGLFHSVSDERNFPDIAGISLVGSAPDSSNNSKIASKSTSASAPDQSFDDSNDDEMITELTSPNSKVERFALHESEAFSSGNSKSKKGSQNGSEPLFNNSENQSSKSSTRDVRDSVEKFMENWISESTKSSKDVSPEKTGNECKTKILTTNRATNSRRKSQKPVKLKSETGIESNPKARTASPKNAPKNDQENDPKETPSRSKRPLRRRSNANTGIDKKRLKQSKW